MKRILFGLFAMLVVCVLAAPAYAALINRGMDSQGNRLIYDQDLDITWYDYSNNGDSWQNQRDWALGLSVNFGGDILDDWRLPTALNLEAPFGPNGPGFNATGSEMGHLYYTELFNTRGGSLNYTGDFQNLSSRMYWSGTEYAPNALWAWLFDFDGGYQTWHVHKHNNLSAVAVRSGDVAAVPEPATVALLGIGLAGLAVYGVRRRRKII